MSSVASRRRGGTEGCKGKGSDEGPCIVIRLGDTAIDPLIVAFAFAFVVDDVDDDALTDVDADGFDGELLVDDW